MCLSFRNLSPAKVLVDSTRFPGHDNSSGRRTRKDKNYKVTVTYKNQTQTKDYNPKISTEKELKFTFNP